MVRFLLCLSASLAAAGAAVNGFRGGILASRFQGCGDALREVVFTGVSVSCDQDAIWYAGTFSILKFLLLAVLAAILTIAASPLYRRSRDLYFLWVGLMGFFFLGWGIELVIPGLLI